MFFATALLAFVLAAPQASRAAPANEVLAERDLVSRVDGHLFVCTDWNFGGSCKNIGFTSGVCQNFPSAFQDDISSVGPDSGFVCALFIDYNCSDDQGAGYRTEYPGDPKLEGAINDSFSSFVCSDPL